MRSISEVAANLLGLSIYQLGAKIAAIRGDAITKIGLALLELGLNYRQLDSLAA